LEQEKVGMIIPSVSIFCPGEIIVFV